MRYLDSHTIDELAAREGGQRLSLFMPVRRAGAEMDANRIRLKSLLAAAAEALAERGVAESTVNDVLAPARELLDAPEFWSRRGDGLALFLDESGMQAYHVDHDLPERIEVGGHFDIRPVVAPSLDDARFALLAISPKRVRLFTGDRSGLTEATVPDMPADMAGYEAILGQSSSVQHHAHQAPMHRTPHSEGQAQYHGHGGGGDDSVRKVRLAEFARMVDRAVAAFLNQRGEALPLLVVAAEPMGPIYRDGSEYPQLVDEVVSGNPDEWDADDLHRRAWPVLEQRFAAARERLRERLQEALGRTGSDQLQEVLPAAQDGRVEVLLVVRDEEVHGTFDRDRRQVERRADGPEELLGLAASLTRRNGGRVHAVPRSEIPGEVAVAAVFRY